MFPGLRHSGKFCLVGEDIGAVGQITPSDPAVDDCYPDESILVSAEAGALRRVWSELQPRISQRSGDDPQPAQPSQASPAGPLNAAPSSWLENTPPKLSHEAVAAMVRTFTVNFSGEVLDNDAMPSIRLLSITHQMCKDEHAFHWVPFHYRLSQKQYSDQMEAKSVRPIRSELQMLAHLVQDDTPTLSTEGVQLTPGWCSRTQTVLRNSFVLCGQAHLHTFKVFDKRMHELVFARFEASSGLRSVNMSELLQADKRIWQEMCHLLNVEKWPLDNVLNEFAHARNDLASLLQPRPRTQLPTKASGSDFGGRRAGSKPVIKDGEKNSRVGGRAAQPGSLCTYLIQNKERKTLCMRYNTKGCDTSVSPCKYLHACAFKLENGRPCGQAHAAHEHKVRFRDRNDID